MKQEKDILKHEKDVLKTRKDIVKQEILSNCSTIPNVTRSGEKLPKDGKI